MTQTSALFVDFDNAYISLWTEAKAVAKRFADRASEGFEWFLSGAHDIAAPDDSSDPGRRILMRDVYLNPDQFGMFRRNCTCSGFHTIDCPVLTGQRKTSTDSYMMLYTLDAEDHAKHFDECLILSAETDFTPGLLRLREHSRDTTVMSTVFTSGALRQAASFVIKIIPLKPNKFGDTDTRRADIASGLRHAASYLHAQRAGPISDLDLNAPHKLILEPAET